MLHVRRVSGFIPYICSILTPTGATPLSLVYGAEAVLPLEVLVPSLRVSLHDPIPDEEHRTARLIELESIYDKC